MKASREFETLALLAEQLPKFSSVWASDIIDGWFAAHHQLTQGLIDAIEKREAEEAELEEQRRIERMVIAELRASGVLAGIVALVRDAKAAAQE